MWMEPCGGLAKSFFIVFHNVILSDLPVLIELLLTVFLLFV